MAVQAISPRESASRIRSQGIVIAGFIRLRRLNSDVSVRRRHSGFLAGSSTAAAGRLATAALARRGLGGGGAAARPPVSDSRWPSNTVVSQGRSFSIRTAQIFAAAAASLSGPATSRSCMPSPPLPSFTTMIGRNAASGAFDFDFNRPRHSARRPSDRIGAADIDAEFGSLHRDFGSRRLRRVRVGADGADARLPASALTVTVCFGASGSISLPAAASGGAIIDFAAISGVAGALRAGGFDGSPWLDRRDRGRSPVAGDRRRRGRRGGFVGGGRGRRRHGRDNRGRACGGTAGAAAVSAAGQAGNRRAPPAAALPGDRAGHGIQPLFQHGDAGIQPVAIAVQRLDRGRPAAAPRSGFPWRPTESAAPGASDRRPRPGRAAIRSTTGWRSRPATTAPTERDAPRSEPPQRAAVEFVFLRQKTASARRRCSRPRSRQPDGRYFLAIRRCSALPRPCPNHTANINRK